MIYNCLQHYFIFWNYCTIVLLSILLNKSLSIHVPKQSFIKGSSIRFLKWFFTNFIAEKAFSTCAIVTCEINANFISRKISDGQYSSVLTNFSAT